MAKRTTLATQSSSLAAIQREAHAQQKSALTNCFFNLRQHSENGLEACSNVSHSYRRSNVAQEVSFNEAPHTPAEAFKVSHRD